MTVRQLKKLLEKVEDDRLVVLSRDSEGNGYSPAAQHDVRSYLPDSTWHGECYLEEPITPADRKAGYTEEDFGFDEDGIKKKGMRAAFVLWPTS